MLSLNLTTLSFFLQTELLIQAHLTRDTEALSPELQRDFKRVLELAPRLLEELMKVSFKIYSLVIYGTVHLW